ncbi:MAG: transglutaminase-like domain-containing protein [Betaproteobacteria bacterium]
MTTDAFLDFYRQPGPFTTMGVSAAQVDDLPTDVGVLAKTVQNLLMHRFWSQAYKVEVPAERDREQGIHSAEGTIACAMNLRQSALTATRSPEQRATGNCRNFSVVMTAFLRRKGIPARARCGFSSYFEPGKYVDHWVAEYWNADQSRWILVDAQLDELQCAIIKPDFDPLDVPRERFWVAGQAWQRTRPGDAGSFGADAVKYAAMNFGIADMWGDWFIGGDLTLDMLALLGIEMLPWEPLVLGPERQLPVGDDLALLDRIATMTVAADAEAVDELRRICAADPRLTIPTSRIDDILQAEAAGDTSINPISGAMSS